ncbi:MAG: hypothetical protein D6719_02090 [Candidatus Dadabacteria bacterium]|nr:MAG: hypothetical protein D6719_02090 [Candidatus Dadabacteria bacterium]
MSCSKNEKLISLINSSEISQKTICPAERTLMRAVLVTAINDLRGSKRERVSALNFFKNENNDYIFSFNSICEYLNLNPEKTRQVVLSGKNIRFEKRRSCFRLEGDEAA